MNAGNTGFMAASSSFRVATTSTIQPPPDISEASTSDRRALSFVIEGQSLGNEAMSSGHEASSSEGEALGLEREARTFINEAQSSINEALSFDVEAQSSELGLSYSRSMT